MFVVRFERQRSPDQKEAQLLHSTRDSKELTFNGTIPALSLSEGAGNGIDQIPALCQHRCNCMSRHIPRQNQRLGGIQVHVLHWILQKTMNTLPAFLRLSVSVERISTDFVQPHASVSNVRKKTVKQLKQTEKGSNFRGTNRA
jgi:hypothetical protein